MTDDSAVEGLRRQQRLVFRCVTTFLLDLVARQIRRHDGDFTRAVVYLAAIQASRSSQVGVTTPLPSRGFSVRAIAQSMNLPYETTRRKVAELEVAGLVRRTEGRGHMVAPEPLEGVDYRADGEASWLALRTVIGDLHALGFDFSQFAGGSPRATLRAPADADRIDAIAMLINDFLLRVLEAGVDPHGSMIDAVIFCTLLLNNAELVTNDPHLAWVYAGAETPPPDSHRRPATITGLAQSLGLPHETVRRRIRLHREAGWVKRVTGGYLITVERLQHPAALQTGLMVSHRFLQLLQSVRALGVDVNALARDTDGAAKRA